MTASQIRSTQAHIDEISLAWEAETGCDSIDTIQRLYYTTNGGAFLCCWPGCSFARRDPAALWIHVHSAHGKDDLPPDDFDWGKHF